MLLEDFKREKIVYMKQKNKEAVSALNVVISKIMLATIEKKAKGDMIVEADVVSILQKTEKELLEEQSAFMKAARQETVDTLQKQIDIIKAYLPTMMSCDEIRTEIEKLEDRSMPAVMKYFKLNFAGKCDMKEVGVVLRSL